MNKSDLVRMKNALRELEFARDKKFEDFNDCDKADLVADCRKALSDKSKSEIDHDALSQQDMGNYHDLVFNGDYANYCMTMKSILQRYWLTIITFHNESNFHEYKSAAEENAIQAADETFHSVWMD